MSNYNYQLGPTLKQHKRNMTTWYTYIVVCGCGCPDILDEFQDAHCVDDDTVNFDLNSVVPMPAEIAGGTEAAQIAWQKKNWGCSGKAYAVEDRSDDHHHFSFDFFTYDGPPERVFAAMARQFPSLGFTIYSQDTKDARTRSRRTLKDGRIIAVHKVTDLDAEIRERIRPDMTDQEKRQLAEWCASKKNLLSVGVWLEAIERVAEETEAQNLRRDKVLLS
jgi:hypothetical protein